MIYTPKQARFGECSQWGYWTRLPSAEGCLQPQEFESPTLRIVSQRALLTAMNCCYTETAWQACPVHVDISGGSSGPPLLFPTTLNAPAALY